MAVARATASIVFKDNKAYSQKLVHGAATTSSPLSAASPAHSSSATTSSPLSTVSPAHSFPATSVVMLKESQAFLFKQANNKQMEEWRGEGMDGSIARYQMAMLTSWLPLLYRASNGTDAPILSSRERTEMVRLLEEMIEKLSCEQQEEVPALWLHIALSQPSDTFIPTTSSDSQSRPRAQRFRL